LRSGGSLARGSRNVARGGSLGGSSVSLAGGSAVALGWGFAYGRGLACGDPRDHLADRDGIPLLDEDLGDGATGGRGQLDVHLVGGDLDDRVGGLDEAADFDAPFEDRSLADGLAGGRGDDVDDLLRRRACRHRGFTLARPVERLWCCT